MPEVIEQTHQEPEVGHSHGRTLFEWSVPEYSRYERGKLWYAAAIAAGCLLLLYAFRTGNFLFAVIISMFGVIMFLNGVQEPRQVRFALTERGIIWGGKYHPYIDVKSFWIVYQPPEVKNLYLEFNSALSPRLQVPLLDENPLEVREALKKVVREDVTRVDEPLSDFLGRVLKI